MFHSKFPPFLSYLAAIITAVLLFSLTGFGKSAVRSIKQEIYDWQRSLKKDLNGCELKNQKEVFELKGKIAVLEEENRAQRRLLSAPLPKNWQFLPVKVVGLEGETLTIDAGKDDGIEKEMPVIEAGTFLGRIAKVEKNSAEVRLSSFVEEKSVVSIFFTKDKSVVGRGLLVGWGEGRMKVEQIYLSENTQKNDLVMLNTGGADLLVGIIDEIIDKKGEMFKSAAVKRLYNPEELGTVFVVKGKL